MRFANTHYKESTAGHGIVDPNQKRPRLSCESCRSFWVFKGDRVQVPEPEGKGQSIFAGTPQVRASGTAKSHSCRLACAGQRGCCSLCPRGTRPREAAPRTRPPVLTCSSCQPPSAPSCAEWTATSRSAPPFPAFPGLHTHHPQHKQTPGRASPLIPTPQPPSPCCACAQRRPAASKPHPRRDTHKRTLLARALIVQ